MPSTTTCDRGHVVVVAVPFSNHSGMKSRPAVVVSSAAFHRTLPDIIVCPISSQPRYHRRPGSGDCPLREWAAVGLRHPSTVRVSKLLSVDKKIIQRTLGRLSSEDLRRIGSSLQQALGLS